MAKKTLAEKELEEAIKKQLETQYLRGLSQGSKAMCATIIEMAANPVKTNKGKINDIIEFCKKSLALVEFTGNEEDNKIQ